MSAEQERVPDEAMMTKYLLRQVSQWHDLADGAMACARGCEDMIKGLRAELRTAQHRIVELEASVEEWHEMCSKLLLRVAFGVEADMHRIGAHLEKDDK
jgi:hypothetical protein